MNLSSRVATWIRGYGVSRLAKDLCIRPTTIYNWITANPGYQKRPSVESVQAMIRLSSDSAALTYDDFFGEVKL